MNKHPIPPDSRRPVHTRETPPHTWGGIALYAAFAALIPLTAFALAHPVVVIAALAGVTAGLLARPLHHRVARRANQSTKSERWSDTVGATATRD